MPEPTSPSSSGSLLTRKLGPLPVWVYALVILAGAWVYAKRRNAQDTTNSTSSSAASPENPQGVAPQFVIENNMPATIGGANTPVTSPSGGTPPVVTPPGKGPKPPVSGGGHKPPPKPPAKPPKKKGPGKPPLKYRVEPGDNLTSIAQRHGISEHDLWAFNTDPKNRSATAIATLKRRGQNEIFPGEEILIPQT